MNDTENDHRYDIEKRIERAFDDEDYQKKIVSAIKKLDVEDGFLQLH